MTVAASLLFHAQEEKRTKELGRLAETLATRLAAGDLTEVEMNAIMADHDREVSELNSILAGEKEKQMADLRDKLRRRREEKEAALLRKQQEEVCTLAEASFSKKQ